LLSFLEQVTSYADNSNSVDVIFLDIAKAFEKVPHKRLLKKLNGHGIHSKIWMDKILAE